MRRDTNDIKAPDGYVLGGLRRVRKDGTILFNRGWWELPDEVKPDYVGEHVWVHESSDALGRDPKVYLEVAQPGLHIFEAQSMRPPHTVFAARNDRPDAKPSVRLQWRKDWIARQALQGGRS